MIGDTLKQLRNDRRYTQEKIASLLEIPRSTYTRYECNINSPDYETLIKIADIFSVSIDFLLGRGNFIFDQKLKHITDLYTNANLQAKDTALFALERGQMEKVVKLVPQSDNLPGDTYDHDIDFYEAMSLYDYFPVSAGIGSEANTEYHETIYLKKAPPKGATYVCRISGDSMEPEFYDGDKVFVKYQPAIDIGQIGIFVLRGESYIKELGQNCLISLNPDYPPKSFTAEDEIYCCGLVLDVCDESYLA